MLVSSFASDSKENSPEWQGWMLPVQQDGHLLHVSYYAADVAAFAETFMLKTGMKKMGQRQLPMAGGEKWQSVEARTAFSQSVSCFLTES